jgi:hypothetical protein
MTKNGVRAAVAGEKFTFAKDHLHRLGEQEVKPKGEGNTGQWICCSCGLIFSNQMQKDSHAFYEKPSRKRHMTLVLGEPASHVLAWLSNISGDIEVP